MNKPEEVSNEELLNKAVTRLIIYEGWVMHDIFIVISHLFMYLMIIFPVILFLVIERLNYSPYSLMPHFFLITWYISN